MFNINEEIEKPTFIELWNRFNSMKICYPLSREQTGLLALMAKLYPGRAEKALTKKVKKHKGATFTRMFVSADPREKILRNRLRV
jgi:hypothetical protein